MQSMEVLVLDMTITGSYTDLMTFLHAITLSQPYFLSENHQIKVTRANKTLKNYHQCIQIIQLAVPAVSSSDLIGFSLKIKIIVP